MSQIACIFWGEGGVQIIHFEVTIKLMAAKEVQNQTYKSDTTAFVTFGGKNSEETHNNADAAEDNHDVEDRLSDVFGLFLIFSVLVDVRVSKIKGKNKNNYA